MCVEGFAAKYLYLRKGHYYFCKWIPKDLSEHYKSQKIVHSLNTKSRKKALFMARSMNSKIEDYWLGIRLKKYDVPESVFLQKSATDKTPTLIECLDHYLSVKGNNRSQTFERGARRAIDYLVNEIGNKRLSELTPRDAISFRGSLFSKNLSSSTVKRVFGSVKAIINLTINELGIETKNHFTGLYFGSDDAESKRQPIPVLSISKLQSACIKMDDDLRWLVALISDTGMRLSEATGLLIDDLNIEGDIPHVIVQSHPHRSLKTKSSKRLIPLIGASLWAANQLVQNQSTTHCFPRYSSYERTNSNSASAAINKWLKSIVGNEFVIHGLRHSFRDRLRDENVPTEVIDQLGGWSLQTIGQQYGNGFNLSQLHKNIKRISLELPILQSGSR